MIFYSAGNINYDAVSAATFNHSPVGARNRVAVGQPGAPRIDAGSAPVAPPTKLATRAANAMAPGKSRANSKFAVSLELTSLKLGELIGALSHTRAQPQDCARAATLLGELQDTMRPMALLGADVADVLERRLACNLQAMDELELIALANGLANHLGNELTRFGDRLQPMQDAVSAELNKRQKHVVRACLRMDTASFAEALEGGGLDGNLLASIWEKSAGESRDIARNILREHVDRYARAFLDDGRATTAGQLHLVREHKLQPEDCVFHSATDAAMVRLGEGSYATVYETAARRPNGTLAHGVFKPFMGYIDQEQISLGFDPLKPAWAHRNVACWRLARRLGTKVIPETVFLLRTEEWGMGCFMEKARGTSPANLGHLTIRVSPEDAYALGSRPDLLTRFAQSKGFKNALVANGPEGSVVVLEVRDATAGSHTHILDFRNSDLRRELTTLQWLDALTGEIDRKDDNYFIEIDAQGHARVTGIDNDMSFTTRIADPDRQQLKYSMRLPALIDAGLRRALLELARNPERLEEDCAGLGTAEIDAAKARLTAIERKLLATHPDGTPVVAVLDEGEDWSTSDAARLLGIVIFPPGQPLHQAEADALDQAGATSYVARQVAAQVRAQAGPQVWPHYARGELEDLARGIRDSSA